MIKFLLKINSARSLIYQELVMNFRNSVLLIFFLILGAFLYYKYKGRLTPEEKKKKNLEQEKYILETIKKTRNKKQKHQNLIITDLPTLEPNANLKRFA